MDVLKEAMCMSTQERKTTRSKDFNAEVNLGPDATFGDKLRALRLSKRMTLTALSRASGLSDRAIRYFENNERRPGVDAVKKLAAALEVNTDYFMEDDIFQQELQTNEILARAKERYGSRGMAQAREICELTKALYTGERLSEEERESFRDLMMGIFFETNEDAKN